MIALKGPSHTLVCVFMSPQNADSHGCWAVWCLVPWDVNWRLSMSFNSHPGVCAESLNWLPVQLSCPTQRSSFECTVEHMSHICGFVQSGWEFWLCMLQRWATIQQLETILVKLPDRITTIIGKQDVVWVPLWGKENQWLFKMFSGLKGRRWHLYETRSPIKPPLLHPSPHWWYLQADNHLFQDRLECQWGAGALEFKITAQ